MIFIFRSFPDLFTQLIISPIKDCEAQTIFKENKIPKKSNFGTEKKWLYW